MIKLILSSLLSSFATPSPTTATSPAATSSCPTGWIAFNGYGYPAISGQWMFNGASDFCASDCSCKVHCRYKLLQYEICVSSRRLC
uniref:Uncharacterized protein n=1 Tax=Parascaris univalens TaxID=6257 RepID=A0A915C5C4_PARUN